MTPKELWREMAKEISEERNGRIYSLNVESANIKEIRKLQARMRWLKHAHYKKDMLLPEMSLNSWISEDEKTLHFQLRKGNSKGAEEMNLELVGVDREDK